MCRSLAAQIGREGTIRNVSTGRVEDKNEATEPPGNSKTSEVFLYDDSKLPVVEFKRIVVIC